MPVNLKLCIMRNIGKLILLQTDESRSTLESSGIHTKNHENAFVAGDPHQTPRTTSSRLLIWLGGTKPVREPQPIGVSSTPVTPMSRGFIYMNHYPVSSVAVCRITVTATSQLVANYLAFHATCLPRARQLATSYKLTTTTNLLGTLLLYLA